MRFGTRADTHIVWVLLKPRLKSRGRPIISIFNMRFRVLERRKIIIITRISIELSRIPSIASRIWLGV